MSRISNNLLQDVLAANIRLCHPHTRLEILQYEISVIYNYV